MFRYTKLCIDYLHNSGTLSQSREGTVLGDDVQNVRQLDLLSFLFFCGLAVAGNVVTKLR